MTNNNLIVILVDNYHPMFSPVAKCSSNIADLLSEKFEICVLTSDGGRYNKDMIQLKNQKIYRLSTKYQKRRYKYELFLQNKTKILSSVVNLFLIRLLRYIKVIFSRTSLDNSLVDVYYNKLVEIRPSIVIPVCIPYETVLASIKYKDAFPSTILLPLLFDRFTFNKSLHRNSFNLLIKKNNHMKIERLMILKSNHIFAMHQLRDNFLKIEPDLINQFSFVEHPLLINAQQNYLSEKDGNIKMLYAGALYKKYRSPNHLLEIVKLLGNPYLLSLYSNGNCGRLIKKYEKANSNILNFGFVESEILKKAYDNCDIFINIGNRFSKNVTSKVFEYMSTGKPIIHIYSNINDPVTKILSKYPNCLIIHDKDKIDENIQRIKKFYSDTKNSIIPFEEVSIIFKDALPSYLSSLFESKITKYQNNA